MGPTLDQMMEALPDERRRAVEVRAQELLIDRWAARTACPGSAQPGADRRRHRHRATFGPQDRASDRSLSFDVTRFMEASGDMLDLRVELPGNGIIRLTGIGDLHT